MWKYLRLLPIIVYPYVYIFYVLFFFSSFVNPEYVSDSAQIVNFIQFFSDISDAVFIDNPQLFMPLLIATAILINVLPVIVAITNVAFGIKGRYTARQTARLSIIAKCCHIPAYLFHFAVGIFGIFMSVWGIGFILTAITVDLLTIALTGINALGCPISLYKSGKISKTTAVLLCIGSFVYCVDIAVAIYLFVKTKPETEISDNTEVVIN